MKNKEKDGIEILLFFFQNVYHTSNYLLIFYIKIKTCPNYWGEKKSKYH